MSASGGRFYLISIQSSARVAAAVTIFVREVDHARFTHREDNMRINKVPSRGAALRIDLIHHVPDN